MMAVSLLVAMAACGGGGGDGDGDGGGGDSAGAQAPAGSATPTAPATSASFFDAIFVRETGTGYYQFAANLDPETAAVTSAGKVQYFVSGNGDTTFGLSASAVAGAYRQVYANQAYITAEGTFTAPGWSDAPIGPSVRIFRKFAQGYEAGVQGMTAPLYRVNIDVQDVSGRPLADVVQMDAGRERNGLASLLADDASAMPAGAQIYQVPYTALVTHLWANLASGKTGETSLDTVQASAGGTIQSLGGCRYLVTPDGAAYVEYRDQVYSGALYTAGTVVSAVPAAYNRVAADFIASREVEAIAGQRAQ